MNSLNYILQNEGIQSAVIDGIKDQFPIEGKKHKLVLNDAWIIDKGKDYGDFAQQRKVKLDRGSWAVPAYADISLVDKATGQVIDRKKRIKIANVPKLTNRFSVIVDGNEYQTTNQFRLKTGIYTRVKDNGQLESQFNLDPGFNFKLTLDPETEVFYLNAGNRKFRLYNLLYHIFNVSDQKLLEAWGKAIFESNRASSLNKEVSEIESLYETVSHKKVPFKEAKADLYAYFKKTGISPETTKLTLGESFDTVDEKTLLATSKKLLEVMRGKADPDERDSLIFKSMYGVDDLTKQFFDKNAKGLKRSLEYRIDTKTQIPDIISSRTYSEPIKAFFTTSDLVNPPPQTNPINIIDEWRKTTITGTGGVTSHHAITMDVRNVHPSTLGYMDATATPESGKVGVTLGMSLDAEKRDGDITTPVILRKTGKKEKLSPLQFYDKYIGFPDEYRLVNGKPVPKNKTVRGVYQGKTDLYPADKIEGFVPYGSSMFSISSNLIPFLAHDQGNRAMMGNRMMGQAVSIVGREAPRVKVKLQSDVAGKDKTFEDVIGNTLNPKALGEGTVTKITKDFIHIKDKKSGDTHKHGLYNNFPLNQESFLQSTPLVEVGQDVKAGQLLSENNFNKDGHLALGKNVNVAYMPWRGYNFEDAAVITESFAKDFASEHIIKKTAPLYKTGVMNLKRFRAYFPEMVDLGNAQLLDEEGVIKPGSKVKEGQTIFAYMVEKDPTRDEVALKNMHRTIAVPFKPTVMTWDHTEPGVVTDVKKFNKLVTIYIKVKQPMVVGDKIANKHGNKGIIAKIIPDEDAPHTLEGERIDLMFNPHGVPGRINAGQILETAAGKLAKHTNKDYIVENFDGTDHISKLKEEYKKNGLEFDEMLTDGKDGKQFKNPIFTGNQYVMKLHHTVEHKMKARDIGGYDVNEQPSRGEHGGQSMDAMQMYAQIAHGNKATLSEMTSLKGQKNDEYWRALQLGLPLPPPQKNFAFEKMINMLKAAGVNTEKNGNRIKLLPLTDKDTENMSNGELTDAAAMLRGKNLAPRAGGLFDKDKTGGLSGKYWSHINLAVKIPNPMFENAITKVLGITNPEFERLMESDNGSAELERRLAGIDIDAELDVTKKLLAKAPKTDINKYNKRLRYLLALKSADLKPVDAYMMKKLPVLPPAYRPIYPLPSGDLMTSPINEHYRDVATINDGIKSDQELSYGPGITAGTSGLYKSVKALQGFTDPVVYTQQKYEGVMKTLVGDSPKEGYIQNRVWAKKQDLSARSTIVVEPTLGLNEVGLPDTIAKTIYKPFIVKKLIEMGTPAIDARKEVADWSPRAERALDLVMDERPVYLNRAPTLHKHGVQAFKPVKMSGKSIKLNPLVVGGFNADFDGDCVSALISMTYVLESAELERLGLTQYSDLTLETLMAILYGETWRLTHNHLESMFKDILVKIQKDGKATFDIHIKDFPYDANTKETTPKGNEAYKVSDGVYVYAYKDGEIKLMPVSHWSIHKDLESVEVKTTSGRSVICSKDHSLFTYNSETGELEKSTPDTSVGKLTPIPMSLNTKNSDPQGFDDGYFVGAIVGDGWLNGGGKGCKNGNHKNAIMLASIHDELTNKLSKYIGKSPSVTENTHDYDGYKCHSKKATWSDANLSQNVLATEYIGHGAKNKHLPYDFLHKSEPFRYGLLSGLIDTDGSVSISNGKSKKQYMANYSSSSKELALQVGQLLASLGIRSSKTAYTRKGETYYTISISMVDLITKRDNIHLEIPKKKQLLAEATTVKDDKDVIPIPFDLCNSLQKLISFKEYKSLYTVISKSKKTGIIGRASAKRAYDLVNKTHFTEYATWVKDVLLNNKITWDKIKSATDTGLTETLWDLTVPDTWTFMTSDMLIVWDTMSIHVPVGGKAVDEAKATMPSEIIFKAGDNAIVPEIAMEYMLGIYYLTKSGKDTGKTFASEKDAKAAGLDDQAIFTLKGVGKTTLGRIRVNKVLPEELRDYTKTLNKGDVNTILENVAKKHKNQFATVISSLKDMGNQYSHDWGSSISITDFDVNRKLRDDVVKRTALKLRGIKDPDVLKTEWGKAKQEIMDLQGAQLRKSGNRIQDMLDSGSAKKQNQVTQLIMFPGLFEDIKGNPLPTPFVKSYAEGFNTFDYWNSMYGVRKGAINSAVNTQETGALNKELLSTLKSMLIVEEDCETDEGIYIEITSKDVLDRALAEDVSGVGKKNEIVDNALLGRAKAKRLKKLYVRSPLTCDSINGVCQLCYGLMPGGELAEIGTNVGILNGQSITERATQLTLQTRHTGGAVGGQGAVAGSFPRLRELFDVPKTIPNQATIADGGKYSEDRVLSVAKNNVGGYDIRTRMGKTYKIAPGLQPLVKKNDTIEPGQQLSAGNARPQDIQAAKGHLEAQKYIVDQMNAIYGDKFYKKGLESVVRGYTNKAVVEEAPDDSEFVRGDIVNMPHIKRVNRDRKAEGLEKIKVSPKFYSIRLMPSIEDDWLSRLSTRYLKKTITDGAARGMETNLHGTDPMPAYLAGESYSDGDFY